MGFHDFPKVEFKVAGYMAHRGSLSHSRFRCWGARLLCSRCEESSWVWLKKSHFCSCSNLQMMFWGTRLFSEGHILKYPANPTTEEYLWTLHGSIGSPTGSEFNRGLNPKVSKEICSNGNWIWNSSCIVLSAVDVDLLTSFVLQEYLLGGIFALCKAGWRLSWLDTRWQDQELLIS